jgi:hypothetical protein
MRAVTRETDNQVRVALYVHNYMTGLMHRGLQTFDFPQVLHARTFDQRLTICNQSTHLPYHSEGSLPSSRPSYAACVIETHLVLAGLNKGGGGSYLRLTLDPFSQSGMGLGRHLRRSREEMKFI